MNIIEHYNNRMNERRRQRLQLQSCDTYQIKELNKELWLTYNGYPVLPASMINGDIVTRIDELRKKFVERNTNNNETGSIIEG